VKDEIKTTVAAATVTLTDGGTLTAGSLNLAGDLTVGTATTGAVTVNGDAKIGGTLTCGTGAAVLAFNGVTSIKTLTQGTNGATIGGSGAVTITDALTGTDTSNVTITNTTGVTLTAANTLAANLVATKATIVGDTTTGVTIKSDATDITVPTDATITVSGEGSSIVAGGTPPQVSIAGATLKPGKYTGATDGLTIDDTAGGEIEVDGTIDIAGAGDLKFNKAAAKVTLKAGGSIDVKVNTGKFGASTLTNTTITVENSDDPGNATKATKNGTSPDWTVTTEPVATGTGVSLAEIILGKLKLPVSTNALNATACTGESSGAIGKLTAGTKTVIIFAGTGS
jgi:fibronectin-binding autotransporter adhesin